MRGFHTALHPGYFHQQRTHSLVRHSSWADWSAEARNTASFVPRDEFRMPISESETAHFRVVSAAAPQAEDEFTCYSCFCSGTGPSAQKNGTCTASSARHSTIQHQQPGRPSSRRTGPAANRNSPVIQGRLDPVGPTESFNEERDLYCRLVKGSCTIDVSVSADFPAVLVGSHPRYRRRSGSVCWSGGPQP